MATSVAGATTAVLFAKLHVYTSSVSPICKQRVMALSKCAVRFCMRGSSSCALCDWGLLPDVSPLLLCLPYGRCPNLCGRDDDVHRHVVLQHLGHVNGARLQHLRGIFRPRMARGSLSVRNVFQRSSCGRATALPAACILRLSLPVQSIRSMKRKRMHRTSKVLYPTWQSCTVVTTSVFSSMAPIHRRMPYSSSAKPCGVQRTAGKKPHGAEARLQPSALVAPWRDTYTNFTGSCSAVVLAAQACQSPSPPRSCVTSPRPCPGALRWLGPRMRSRPRSGPPAGPPMKEKQATFTRSVLTCSRNEGQQQ